MIHETSFVSHAMSAVQIVEHVHVIKFEIVIPGLMPGVSHLAERVPVYEEPRGVPGPAPMPSVVSGSSEGRGLVDLYKDLLSARDAERRVSDKTIRDNLSVLRRFQTWSDTAGKLNGNQPVRLLEMDGILREFAEHMRSQEKGNSSAMANKALGVIVKLSNACQKEGLISKQPERVSKGSINLMRPRTEKQWRIKGVPVTIDEIKAMLAVLDGCRWPRLGKVKPSVFWRLHLLSHFLYGFRSEDWISCRGKKKGLLWSGITKKTECPVLKGLHNDGGWAFYMVHKTANKDEAADRNPEVLVPLSIEISELIEQFRGLDDERVFPTKTNSRTYSKEFSGILDRAGLSDAARIAAEEPIIRPSLGQSKVASLRKSCSNEWTEMVGPQAASYLLHHYVSVEGVAKMTMQNYLQHEAILRKIVAKLELMAALVS